MASLLQRKSRTGKTLYTVQFVLGHKRPCVPLGNVSKSQALQAKGYIEALVAARRSNVSHDGKTASWLADIDESFFARLVACGLVEPREAPEPAPEQPQTLLGVFLDSYIGKRSDVKHGTATVYGHTRRCLVEYFGADRSLTAITPADCDDWARWLRQEKPTGQGLAENTARRRCGIAKQFLRDACRRRLLSENPFDGMKGISVLANRERDYFVTRADAAKVIEACPDSQWRLLFALSRYGGLRCPSEHLALRWGDIDWQRQRITVRASKTAHHEGGGVRIMPLFPELRPHLETAWDEAPGGTEYVITRYRESNANLRTQLQRIIAKAGLVPWPKLFQNLRASRATELADEFPSNVAADWLGHSTTIADKHYRQTTEEHFARALQPCAAYALQQGTETRESDGNGRNVESEKRLDVGKNREMYTCIVGDEGLEPPTSTL